MDANHKRGPSYLECVRNNLLPDSQELLCEETLCRGVCRLTDVLCNDSPNDFIRTLLKTLPRRCQPRDMEEQALRLLKKNPDGMISRIFQWARMGNARHVTWRPPLNARITIMQEPHEKTVELAEEVPRALCNALTEFVAVAIRDCHPYCAVMQRQMCFDEFWHNACQLADRVFRPHLVKATLDSPEDTERAISLWQKKNRKAYCSKPIQNAYSSLFRILNKMTNSNKLPTRRYVFNSLLVASFPSDQVYQMLRKHPHIPKKIWNLFSGKWVEGPKKKIQATIEKSFSRQEIHHLASFFQAFLRPRRVCLSPLPWYFFDAQQDQHRTYRVCPQCCAHDFLIQGYEHAPAQFSKCARRNWIPVCTACSSEGIPTIPLTVRGQMVFVVKKYCLLCCHCNE